MAKEYDVYGLGNALVDMIYEVNDGTLSQLKVDKGLMTLVDEPRQNELLQHLADQTAKRTAAGSGANSIIAVAQFGGKSFYSCKVANDEAGDFFMKDFEEVGVSSNLRADNRQEGTTGKCLVLVTPDAERSMNTFLGITASLSKTELVEDALKLSKYLYLEGYLAPSPDGVEACVEARKIAQANDVKVSLSLSDPNMVAHFKDGLSKMIGEGIDLIFCNEDEAKGFTGAADAQEACEALKKLSKTFVITRGSNGSLVWDGDRLLEVGADQVKAVDSNGAGDMFAGTFLHALTCGKDYLTSARMANYAAGEVVSQFGPRLEAQDAQRIKEKLQQF